MSKLLLIDIGNTCVKTALCVGRRMSRRQTVSTAAVSERSIRSTIRKCLGAKPVDGVVISSVVPSANPAWRKAAKALTGKKPMLVSHKLKLNIGIDYPKPETIGADRLAAMCGAAFLFKGASVVCDCGTALTIDVIDRVGAFVGGIIAPGPQLLANSLHSTTALLPEFQLKNPSRRVGRSTIEALQIGSAVGYRGLVKELLASARKVVGGRVRVVASGSGTAKVMKDAGIKADVQTNLIFIGMAEIFELNNDGD